MEAFIGTIMLFGGNFAPRGWMYCAGQLLAISEYQALFSILGTEYGGDGRTTFALPDLRGRAPVGPGHGPGLTNIRIGEKGGVEQQVLTPAHLPPQRHTGVLKNATVQVSSGGANSDSPAGNVLAKTDISQRGGSPITGNIYSSSPDSTLAQGSVTGEVDIDSQGQSLPIDNRAPFTGVHYIICIEGLYPSRN